jgi:hypothetical protein
MLLKLDWSHGCEAPLEMRVAGRMALRGGTACSDPLGGSKRVMTAWKIMSSYGNCCTALKAPCDFLT